MSPTWGIRVDSGEPALSSSGISVLVAGIVPTGLELSDAAIIYTP